MQRLSLSVRDTLCSKTPIIRAPHVKRHYDSSNTTEAVLRALLSNKLCCCNAPYVARSLGISASTLRRRLKEDNTSFSHLSDRVRQYRCEQILAKKWLPGKCLAFELGYSETNSFYRAFRRWTGLAYSDYKKRLH
jgi:AraC-like DNA-binding protein